VLTAVVVIVRKPLMTAGKSAMLQQFRSQS
jgi:hypothetical protein